ncbi:MAG TPA: ABC transporter [Gammaproteobacteria bacterium]|nr:ABC transporter [Gammaproteobacteria bacterium]
MPLNQYFKLIDTHAKLQLRADASRYFFGYLWWLLEPLLYVLVFYVVFELLLDSGRSDFLVFLMCGKLVFVWFSKSVTQASNSIIDNNGLIGMIDIPKSLFPLAVLQQGIYRQLAVFVLLIAFLLLSGYSISVEWLYLLPLVIVNYLVIAACALIGASLVCFMRDVSLIIGLGMIFMLFVSGVFWDVRALDNVEMTRMILIWNPLAFLIDAYRQIFMFQQVPDLTHLFLLGLSSGCIVYIVSSLMRKYSQAIALRALSA